MEKLKAFALGFFSDGCANKAAKGGFLPLIINLVLAIAIVFLGTVGADMFSFYPRYGSAENFKGTVSKLFAPDEGENAISILVDEDGLATASRGGGEYEKALLVDTFSSESDRKAYSVGGYNVVVDTRDAALYDDFIAYCEPKSGEGETITYEQYLSLSESAKDYYIFKIRYTPFEADLSDEKTADREKYLSDNGGEQSIAELKSKLTAGEISAKEYNGGVWELFVKSYYPDLGEYETTSAVPLLRNYYYHNYTLKGETDYLFVFDDSVIGSFTADGRQEEFYGFYNKFPAGVTDGGDGFIETAFSGSVYLSEYIAFVNVIRFLPVYVVMPLTAALIAYLIIKIAERERAKRFSEVVKITATFIAWSAVFAAVITFILSFFIDRGLIFTVLTVSFFVVMMIRTVVWFATETAKFKKAAEDIGESGEKFDSLRG